MVRSSDAKEWRSFATKSLKKTDPRAYPREHLICFLTKRDLQEGEDLITQVKSRDLREWKFFCDRTLKKNDPRFYPEPYLRAFLEGTEPPPICEMIEDLPVIDKDALVARVKLAIKQGCPPLQGPRKDPQAFSAEFLRAWLYSITGHPAEWPDADAIYDQQKQEVDGQTSLMHLGQGLDFVSRADLISRCKNAVKMGAPPLVGRGRDPARYTNDELKAFLIKSVHLDSQGILEEINQGAIPMPIAPVKVKVEQPFWAGGFRAEGFNGRGQKRPWMQQRDQWQPQPQPQPRPTRRRF